MVICTDSTYVEWYPWLNHPYHRIVSYYQRERRHHAILLYGQPGIGGMSLSYAVSRWLMCQYPNGIKSCKICRNCQLMKAGNHSDFYRLKINKEENGVVNKNIIFSLFEKVYERACQGNIKVVLILNIEYLIKQEVRVLTNIIEAPPKNTYFILVYEKSTYLESTLKSHCLCWPILTPSESLGVRWLVTMGYKEPTMARTALRLCSNVPVAAESFLKSPSWKERLTVCAALQNAINIGDYLVLLEALTLGNNNQPLQWLLSFFSDAMKWKHQAQQFIVNLDKACLVSTIAEKWSCSVLYDQWRQWLHCLGLFKKFNNLNREVMIIHYLLKWEEIHNPYSYKSPIK